VGPSPVSIHSDRLLNSLAATRFGASTKVHGRMILLFLVSNLLGGNETNKSSNSE
jgi:L-asparaginase/Glu-tRNA(Gln) amidotransferase subunit D